MKGKKIFNFILGVVMWVVIIVAGFVTILTLSSQERGYSIIFNKLIFSVDSDSMEPEISKGDLLINKKYDSSLLKEKDIIVFNVLENNKKVVRISRINSVSNINGITSYITLSDNNSIDMRHVESSDIVGVYEGKVPVVGTIYTFLKGKTTFFVCILLPLALFFTYQVYNLIMLLIDYKND